MAPKGKGGTKKQRQSSRGRSSTSGPERGGDEQWLTRSLSALGHADPPSLLPCLRRGTAGDDALQNMVIWLEDRVIRQWGGPDREDLRQNFWAAIQRYLKDLECPSCYHDQSGLASSSTHWRDEPTRRSRVVFWLVSCAISESYSDKKDAIERAMNAPGEKSGSEGATSSYKDRFPLGFSTNDEVVDSIVTALRMKYLLDLRAVQDKINHSIAEMQRITVKQEGGKR